MLGAFLLWEKDGVFILEEGDLEHTVIVRASHIRVLTSDEEVLYVEMSASALY